MRYVVWGLVGLIVVGVVVVGGGAYYFANVKVDFGNPQLVAKFKESFSGNCVSTYQKRMSKAGTTPTEDQLANVSSACDCARDPVVDALAKRPVMTVSELADTMATDPEILGITKACSDKFGIENPT